MAAEQNKKDKEALAYFAVTNSGLRKPPLWQHALGGAARIFVFVAFVLLCFIIAVITAPIIAVFFAIFVIMVLGPCVFTFIDSRRDSRANLILSYLESAVRLNLPLVPFLSAMQRKHLGITAWRLARFSDALKSGVSVGGALRDTVPEIPARITESLVLAESVGTLQPVLADLSADFHRRNDQDLGSSRAFRRIYPSIIGSAVALLLFGVIIFILPKFREIFRDFRTPLPVITQTLFDLADFPDSHPELFLFLLFCAIPILLYILFLAVRKLFSPLGPSPFDLTSRPSRLLWFTPFCHGVIRDRGMADVCRFLMDAVRAGVPLPRAATDSARLFVNPILQRRLITWGTLLDRGQPAGDAAREAHLPTLFSGFLDTAHVRGKTADPSVLADTLEFLSRYYRNRFSRTMLALRGAAEPAMTLAMALMVGYVVLALFYPLIALLNHVMDASKGFY